MLILILLNCPFLIRQTAQDVPHGSILGLLLYIIYMSQFYKVFEHCQYHIHANVTQLFYSFGISNCDQANHFNNGNFE